MRVLILGTITVMAACGTPDQRSQTQTTNVLPKDSVVGPVVSKDSAAIAAYEDSVMGRLRFGPPGMVTPTGDTLETLEYGFLQDPAAKEYSFLYYSRNGVRYIAVDRRIDHSSGGLPTRSTSSRLRLPPIDSTDHLVLDGYCAVNHKDAPLVVAITGTGGDSVYRHARHAWKLDTTSGILREIPIKGVMCSHVSGEE